MSSLAAMSDILIRLRNFLKCMIVCCNSQLLFDHSEIDAVDKDDE